MRQSLRTRALVSLLGLALFALNCLPTEAQLRQRTNFYGMHNLRDGGAFYIDGLNWTRHLVGEGGYVFDWVNNDTTWIKEVMDRGLIPCIRVQGGNQPSVGWTGSIAASISEWQTRMGPPYQNRLIYLQLWNEPGDVRDLVSPENFADYMVGAYQAVKDADANGTLRVMTPGQNGPEWWRRAFSHNPQAAFAFDVWATHPYPESYPPHYNHHDGVPFINQVKTIDSYLLDLDVVAQFGRRGFPVMITETAYGDRLGVSFEGYPKTTREVAAKYNVDAFTKYWHNWPEIIAVHPFLLHAWAWEAFAWVKGGSGSNPDGTPTDPYPQYTAVKNIPKPPPARREPFTGPVGVLRGTITRQDTGAPIKYATVFTDGREFGGPSLFDGQYVIRDVPIGTYTLSVEKKGYRSDSTQVTVRAGEETVVNFDLLFEGKVSKGIYFQNQGTCSGCDLFAPFLGQTITTPPDVGFIKFVAGMPNVGNVTMKFSILDGGPTGPQVGESVDAFLEWGGEMIGAEWPGDGVPVEPNHSYFIKMERADGQGVYMYATDANPYADGMAFTGTTPHPSWDLFATVRGTTVAVNNAFGGIAGLVSDTTGQPLAGALVTVNPGNRSTTTGSDGGYTFTGLSEGNYSVSVALAGFSSQTQAGITVIEDQTTTVDFILTEDITTGSITGSVRDTFGTPLSGATIATTTGGHATTTDANGDYIVAGIAAGSYTVRVSKVGYVSHEESSVSVIAGETTILNVNLSPITATLTELANPDFEDDAAFVGVASGWTAFGGNKWELVWDPERSFTQGVTDIPPGQTAGVFQTVSVMPGTTYRVSVYVRTTNPGYEAAIGVDASGQADPRFAEFGASSNASSWTEVATQFQATESITTIFLQARNTQDRFIGGWAQFDGVTIEALESGNILPTAAASASPASGTAPLLVHFDGSASFDPDGDVLSYEWDFDDGSPTGSGATTSHVFAAAGVYDVTLTVHEGRGGTGTAVVTVNVGAGDNLIVNGDFSQSLSGWQLWTERGSPGPTVDGDGQLQVAGTGYNGGIYQQFATGGAGSEISISGFWASDPTQPNSQWAEVLIINGARQPLDGQDINAGQSDVVMIYKNDTFASPAGWSGTMNQTAAVSNAGTFVADADTATIILKSGNLQGVTSGTRYDNIVVSGPATVPPPSNQPPTAAVSATPTSGTSPLVVNFDGSASSDPDGDVLTYTWDFGDGQQASGVSVSHAYNTTGSFNAVLTVDDGRGGTATSAVVINVTAPSSPPASVSWDPRLDSLGVFLEEARVAPGTWYWKLVSAIFESDGEIFPPPGGGSESNGTHAIYIKALDTDGTPLENQRAFGAWPTGNPTNVAPLFTKGAIDEYWGDFAMSGGNWCPFFPEGPRGPYGAYIADAPSDQLWGMGMPCNRHVNYRLTWQWTQKK